MRAGVPPDRLAVEIARYDYGFLVFDITPETFAAGKEMMRHAVGTKLFSYLEAGLPVVVNTEYPYTARWVEEYGMGIALHSSELGTLRERLKAYDYAQAVRNIRNFHETNGMPVRIGDLIGFYKRIDAARLVGRRQIA
jgi:hypothetical protein